MNFKNSFHPYAMVTIFFWSLAYVLTRLTLQYFSAFSLGFIRYIIASCTLIIVAILMKIKLPHRKDIPWFFAAGGMGFFLYIIAFNQGQATVTAATGSVVIATVPVITALFARFVYDETLMAFQWIAIFIEFIGVIVLALMNNTFSVNTGLLWLLLAALVLAVYNLLQRKLTKKYTALQTSTYSIFFWNRFACCFCTIFHSRDLPCTHNTISLYCSLGCMFRSYCLCYMGQGIFQSKTDLASEQLYVYNTFHNKYPRFYACRRNPRQSNSCWWWNYPFWNSDF